MPAVRNAITENNRETGELKKTVSKLKDQVCELTKALYDLSEKLKQA